MDIYSGLRLDERNPRNDITNWLSLIIISSPVLQRRKDSCLSLGMLLKCVDE